MEKDIKIGIVIGAVILVVVSIIIVAVSIKPSYQPPPEENYEKSGSQSFVLDACRGQSGGDKIVYMGEADWNYKIIIQVSVSGSRVDVTLQDDAGWTKDDWDDILSLTQTYQVTYHDEYQLYIYKDQDCDIDSTVSVSWEIKKS